MPMYSLLEHRDNYSVTSGSLWNYYRDEVNDDENDKDNNDNMINNNKTITSESFKFNTKLKGITSDINNKNAEVFFLLKYLSNFLRFINIPIYQFI